MRQTRQSLAIGIDIAATKPRRDDVTGTRDKVQRLHVNPRDTVRVKLTVLSSPRSSIVSLTSLWCLPRPTRLFLHIDIAHSGTAAVNSSRFSLPRSRAR